MTLHALADTVQKARDQAKTILRDLEKAGHPQTSESSGLYLSLVIIQKRLANLRPGTSVVEFVAELEQLARMCTDKLAPLKPLLDDAGRIAKGSRTGPAT